MFGATTNFPFNFVNRRGIPLIESNNVTADATTITVTIPQRAFRFLNDKGGIFFKLNTAIPTASTALPVQFSSGDFTQAVTTRGGANAVGTDFPGTGVYHIFYDKDANLLQLL